jgi:hypothetical protein
VLKSIKSRKSHSMPLVWVNKMLKIGHFYSRYLEMKFVRRYWQTDGTEKTFAQMLYRNYKETKLKNIKMFILSEILITHRKLFDFSNVWHIFLIFFESDKQRPLSTFYPLLLIWTFLTWNKTFVWKSYMRPYWNTRKNSSLSITAQLCLQKMWIFNIRTSR